ncbi:MAG TPA: MBL fold metallo-hydrolase [Vicinamibacterales bacterium]|nr:MBL fold metallo-hydrolase [Vicinamibacterales bacterium]
MTLRFASLGSGSRGNASLVEFGSTLLMIDCGLPRKTIEERLRTLDRQPRDVTAILVTHEHADHAQGVAMFAKRYNTPLWMTPGTASAIRGLTRVQTLSSHRELAIGSINVRPYPVPHDAREPCQFTFAAAGRRLGMLTDAGHVTPHMYEQLTACDALALECNHDLESLQRGPYPESLKIRVASRFGHLNNGQTTELLSRLDSTRVQWIVGLHLSERNNSPEHVRAALQPALEKARYPLHLATQDAPTPWLVLD